MKLRECLEFSKDMGFYIVGEAYSCVDLYSSKIFEPSEIKKEMNELIAEFNELYEKGVIQSNMLIDDALKIEILNK